MVLKMKDEKIRACGLSNSKVSFVKDLAAQIVDGRLHFRGIDKMSEEEVISMLVSVKGIGRWTAEMFLMFALQRPDIFSHGDLGLRNAIIKLYKIKGPLTEKRALLISKKWSPHRTLACHYLWASLNLK
jgi:DNA-3-methyladenine glycosylase II